MLRKLILIPIILFVLLQTAAFPADMAKILQQKISTSFVNTPLERVIRVLSNQYGVNMIVGGDAQGRVTINLTDVPLEEALSAILKSQGYHFVVRENVIYVKSQKLQLEGELFTKVLKLQYQDGFRLKNSLSPMLSSKGKMEALLSEPAEKDKVNRSNLLVVTDFWENVRGIEQVVAQVDQPVKQVQIEVKLIEKLLTDEKKVGLDLPRSLSVKAQGRRNDCTDPKSPAKRRVAKPAGTFSMV